MLDDALRSLSPKSEMAKAIVYGIKRWPALTRFLDDGRLEIDNNIAERAMRRIAIGRKQLAVRGLARPVASAPPRSITVIETCKINGVEPQAYIADVIAKIADDWPASRWDELLPWNWQPPIESPIAQAA